jgi:starch synthase
LSEESIAVLFVGRLSFHAKAHHVPMYRALESATQQTGKTVTLLMAGWFANDAIEAVFREDAARYCPSVRVHFIDGRKPDVRYSIWQAADVFLSLSDNIQESFGLTPVEAMAAGLPTVVSDWDGYRDTVRDGIDGFRIPCVSPAPGFGGDHAARFELGIDNYDHYCSGTSQFIAVDIDAASTALSRLFADPELRGSMGAAGRARATANYDWSTIIRQYQSLWDQLGGLRRSALESVPRGNANSVNPVFRDPWWLYEDYATSRLQPDDMVCATPAANVETLKMLWTGPSTCPGHLQCLLPTLEELNELIGRARTPMTVSDLVKGFPAIRQPFLMRSTLWLMKYGLLAITKD